MIIRNEERTSSAAVRFNGKGDIAMTTILPAKPEAFEGQGRLFNHVVLKPGDIFGVHGHTDEFEVYYILKGEGDYNDNGNIVRVKAGDVTVCKSGEVHGMTNTGTEDLEMIALILFCGKKAAC